MVDALDLHSFSWLDLVAGSLPGSDATGTGIIASSESGITGLADLPPFTTTLTQGQRNGVTPGSQFSGALSPQVRCWTRSSLTMTQWRQAMKPRSDALDYQPWTFRGFGFPGTNRLYVRPDSTRINVTQLATAANVWIMDHGWSSADGLIYSDAAVTQVFGTDESDDGPVTSKDLTVTNDGLDVATMGRAITFRLTAHGPVVNPYILVDHGDGDVRKVVWEGTLTGGQVLTVDEHRVSRIGSQLALGVARFLYGFTYSRSPRWPTARPGASTFQIGAASGTFSGFLQTRSVW